MTTLGPAARGSAIYLDHAATTPMPPAVRLAYADALGVVGNPSSIHGHGQAARDALESAREELAASLGVTPIQVVLTSGGTESINLALKGLFWQRGRRRILSTRAEHHATLDALAWLERHEGAEIDWIDVDAVGRIDLDALAAALDRGRDDVALVTTLLANNEVGTVQPVDEVIRLAGEVPVHVDAVGAWRHVPLPVGAAAISVSAHKIGGPVGVGALVLERGVTVVPLLHGGDQQPGRSGTQDVAGAVAFAAAARLPVDDPALAAERDRLLAGLAGIPGAVVRGDPVDRLPGNAHATFAGCDGDALLFLLDREGFSVSTGAACQAGVAEVSHVLRAMGIPDAEARGALRFTLGASTTSAEVDALLDVLPRVVAQASS